MTETLETLIGGKDMNAETLWVLMGNDYPAAIWRGTQEQVETRLVAVKDAQKAKDFRDGRRVEPASLYSPRVYWRLYPFRVDTLGFDTGSVEIASRMTGIPADSLTQLMHGWAWLQPCVATHRHKARGTFYSLIAEAELQCAVAPREGEMLTVYIGNEDGKWWARPADEFNDGRFVPADQET